MIFFSFLFIMSRIFEQAQVQPVADVHLIVETTYKLPGGNNKEGRKQAANDAKNAANKLITGSKRTLGLASSDGINLTVLSNTPSNVVIRTGGTEIKNKQIEINNDDTLLIRDFRIQWIYTTQDIGISEFKTDDNTYLKIYLDSIVGELQDEKKIYYLIFIVFRPSYPQDFADTITGNKNVVITLIKLFPEDQETIQEKVTSQALVNKGIKEVQYTELDDAWLNKIPVGKPCAVDSEILSYMRTCTFNGVTLEIDSFVTENIMKNNETCSFGCLSLSDADRSGILPLELKCKNGVLHKIVDETENAFNTDSIKNAVACITARDCNIPSDELREKNTVLIGECSIIRNIKHGQTCDIDCELNYTRITSDGNSDGANVTCNDGTLKKNNIYTCKKKSCEGVNFSSIKTGKCNLDDGKLNYGAVCTASCGNSQDMLRNNELIDDSERNITCKVDGVEGILEDSLGSVNSLVCVTSIPCSLNTLVSGGDTRRVKMCPKSSLAATKGDECTVVCRANFVKQTDETYSFSCGVGGVWKPSPSSTSLPTCIMQCLSSPDFDNSSTEISCGVSNTFRSGDPIDPNTVCTLSCKRGFLTRPDQGTTMELKCDDGTWKNKNSGQSGLVSKYTRTDFKCREGSRCAASTISAEGMTGSCVATTDIGHDETCNIACEEGFRDKNGHGKINFRCNDGEFIGTSDDDKRLNCVELARCAASTISAEGMTGSCVAATDIGHDETCDIACEEGFRDENGHGKINFRCNDGEFIGISDDDKRLNCVELATWERCAALVVKDGKMHCSRNTDSYKSECKLTCYSLFHEPKDNNIECTLSQNSNALTLSPDPECKFSYTSIGMIVIYACTGGAICIIIIVVIVSVTRKSTKKEVNEEEGMLMEYSVINNQMDMNDLNNIVV